MRISKYFFLRINVLSILSYDIRRKRKREKEYMYILFQYGLNTFFDKVRNATNDQ